MESPIDLLEEAVHLLRRTPVMTYAYYLVGVVPFTIILFQLLADASYHRYIAEHLSDSAIKLTVGYWWMKGFQGLASRRLFAAYTGEPIPPLGTLRFWLAQCSAHPWGILGKPMAALIVVPSPFVDAFFQNASAVLAGNRGDLTRCLRFSRGPIGPGLALQGIIFVLRVLVFIGVYSTLAALPFLGKILFGIDTPLTRSYQWLISMPFLLATLFLSYLTIDLLLKSLYVVRIRRIECETSGKDLLDRLANISYAAALK